MNEVSVDRAVGAPPERVWEIVTDLERSPEIISGITAVERLDPGEGFGIGTRWRETRIMFGREATEIMEVTELEDGASYAVESAGRGANYRSTVAVEAAEGGSILTMTFTGEPTGTLSKVVATTVGKLFESATRKALIQDMEDIAAAAESG